ncbi:hypothetical protein K438DRAFT_1747926 [Mycena galopus ATCC 62051]|nr:hypothetical protein K438DRAFT_1747926 [Mycena galopus ATCC 62051]
MSSSESSPAAKRQRTEHAPVTRSDTWRNDGNVVLQAGNIQSRVHWRTTPAARTAQPLGQPSRSDSPAARTAQPLGQPSVDECPVVELSDDPKDVEYLLKALYTPTFLSQELLPFPAVGALIRLGRKYDFKDLFDSAVRRLTFEYPTTLEKFDAVAKVFKTIEMYPGLGFDIIALASENNILSVLPSAYYCAASAFSSADLFRGIQRSDGTMAFLPPADLARCVSAREKLLAKQFQPGYTLEWARTWDPAYCTHAECRTIRQTLLSDYMDDGKIGALELSGSPIIMLNDSIRSSLRLCFLCATYRDKCIAAGRKKIWEELPGFFDLPPWSELKNDI